MTDLRQASGRNLLLVNPGDTHLLSRLFQSLRLQRTLKPRHLARLEGALQYNF